MKSFHLDVVLRFLTVVIAGATAGCAEDTPEPASSAEVRIARIPDDVRCFKVKAVGTRTETRTFGATPGASGYFLLTNIPVGRVVVEAEGYSQTCAKVNANQPNWLSEEPTITTVSQFVVAELAINLRRNGRVRLTADFNEEPDAGKP